MKKTRQQLLFPEGQDLPLFSGAPIPARISPYNPTPITTQLRMFDTRPTMTPNEEIKVLHREEKLCAG